VYDSLFPDRIVLGAASGKALDTMRALYEPIIEQSFPTELDPRPKCGTSFDLRPDVRGDDQVRRKRFSCDQGQLHQRNRQHLRAGRCRRGKRCASLGLDERIGSRFLSAGIGWGGPCFPKDTEALRSIAREYDYEPVLLSATISVNERQHKRIISKLQRELYTLKGRRVALLGLAFKPNTDDLREAPSLKIAEALERHGARAIGYDPVAGKKASGLVPNLKVVFDPYEALKGAHAAVLVTEWDELRALDFKRAASLMKEPSVLVDGRNALDPQEVRAAGIRYRGFGRV
jgi:UDPglucose 6-dehydrogenase